MRAAGPAGPAEEGGNASWPGERAPGPGESASGPRVGEPHPTDRDDHGVAVDHELRTLVRALLACCAAALVLGAIGAAVVAMSGGARTVLVPLLTFVALGQLAAVVSGGAALVGSGRLSRGRRGVGPPARAPEGAGWHAAGHTDPHRADRPLGVRQADRGAGRPTAVVSSVGRTFRIVARGLLAACVLVATAWVLAEPEAAAGALTGTLLAGQVAAVLLAAGGRMSAATARWASRR